MGSGSSVQVVKSVEVSFWDVNTAALLPEDKIREKMINACREFDYTPSFYNAYKENKHGDNPYAKYSRDLVNGYIR
jgi:hypothetical protein